MSALPRLGAAVPRRGGRTARALGRAVLAALRWRIEGAIPDLPKFVIAVAPHTSNWDFVVGAAAMLALDLDLSFLGKHTLFRGPLAPAMRWLGGIPVDRSSAHGVVAESARAFRGVDRRVLALAPQGTRKGDGRLRTGFLHIAREAGVPVVPAALDFATRTVRIGPPFDPTGNVDADLARFAAFFAGVRGRHPRPKPGPGDL